MRVAALCVALASAAPRRNATGGRPRHGDAKGGWRRLRGGAATARPHELHHRAPCRCEFLRYTPSELERAWTKNIEKWQAGDVCSKISDVEKMAWINEAVRLQEGNGTRVIATTSPNPPLDAWSHVMSAHTYRRTRGDAVDYLHVPIEPTAAFLRDPRKCWEPMTETFTQSKDFLVPLGLDGVACAAVAGVCTAEDALRSQHARHSQFFLFDAGATLPAAASRTSRKWSGTDFLYEWYAARGIRFDHVYAWEPHTRAENFRGVPNDLVAALSFYPDSVTDAEGDARNPTTLIKKLARPDDVVVFKLDVDSPRVENAIMEAVVGDAALRGLVDDFFFEMHMSGTAR